MSAHQAAQRTSLATMVSAIAVVAIAFLWLQRSQTRAATLPIVDLGYAHYRAQDLNVRLTLSAHTLAPVLRWPTTPALSSSIQALRPSFTSRPQERTTTSPTFVTLRLHSIYSAFQNPPLHSQKRAYRMVSRGTFATNRRRGGGMRP